jgi:hypothetical protein
MSPNIDPIRSSEVENRTAIFFKRFARIFQISLLGPRLSLWIDGVPLYCLIFRQVAEVHCGLLWQARSSTVIKKLQWDPHRSAERHFP